MTVKNWLGFDNKYGRPVPYVWFIIIFVSLIPQLILSAVTDSLPCTETDILNGRTSDEFFNQKGLTIKEAVTKCTEATDFTTNGGRVVGAIMFGSMLVALKPWPLSNPTKNDDEQTTTKKRVTPI